MVLLANTECGTSPRDASTVRRAVRLLVVMRFNNWSKSTSLTERQNMKDENVFLLIKAAITGVTAGFGVAFGWLGWLVIAWITCMALDWVTGSAAAGLAGKLSSSKARDGIGHKGGMIVVVLVAWIADGVLSMVLTNVPNLPIPYTTALLPLVLVWYIFTELISMIENAAAMGAPVPSFLSKILAVAAKASETVGSQLTEKDVNEKEY